jgi:hypothetical protein
MVSKIVVVPCGARKQTRRVPAGDMYTGSYHLTCRYAAARLAGPAGTVLILSAKYGLLRLSDPIDPYELTMGQPGSVTVDTLRQQAARLGVNRCRDVTVVAGKRYADRVSAVWPGAVRPLDGCRGMGEQLGRLARLRVENGEIVWT